VRHLFEESDQRPPLLADVQQRQAEQHREEQHLQDLALGERVDDGRRDDVQQKVDRAQVLRVGGVRRHRLGVERGRVGVDSDARPHEVDDGEPDEERDRRHDLEVDQRPHADAADALHVAHLRDADDDRAEDDRRDHHANQLDEAVAERPQPGAGLRPQVADGHTHRDADEHLEIQVGIDRRPVRWS
jgi:hypothetical protein